MGLTKSGPLDIFEGDIGSEDPSQAELIKYLEKAFQRKYPHIKKNPTEHNKMIYDVPEMRNLTKGSKFEKMVLESAELNFVHITIGFSYDLSIGYEDCMMVTKIIGKPSSVILEPLKAYHYSREGPKEINLRKFLLLTGSEYETEASPFAIKYSIDNDDNVILTQEYVIYEYYVRFSCMK